MKRLVKKLINGTTSALAALSSLPKQTKTVSVVMLAIAISVSTGYPLTSEQLTLIIGGIVDVMAIQ